MYIYIYIYIYIIKLYAMVLHSITIIMEFELFVGNKLFIERYNYFNLLQTRLKRSMLPPRLGFKQGRCVVW